MSAKTKLPFSATMAAAMLEIKDRGGRIVRHQGGYWTEIGAKMQAQGSPFDWYLSTPTVEALVKRGTLKYTEEREGRHGKFPIAAELVPQPDLFSKEKP